MELYTVTEYTDATGYQDLASGLTLATAVPFMQEHSLSKACVTLLTLNSTGRLLLSCEPNGTFENEFGEEKE